MRFSFPSLSLKSSKSSKDVADVDKRGGEGKILEKKRTQKGKSGRKAKFSKKFEGLRLKRTL